MIGLCIGTGDWQHVAQRAAAQMQRMTGVKCRIVTRADNNLVHGSWHKLNLLRDHPGETLFIFDADMWCREAWDPRAYTDTGLAMVREPLSHEVRVECALYHIPETHYYNGGLLVADERAKELFAATKRLHPHYGRWLEQTALNHEIQARGYPVQEIPMECNTLVNPASPLPAILAAPAVNLHFAGRKTSARLHEIFDALEGAASVQPQPGNPT